MQKSIHFIDWKYIRKQYGCLDDAKLLTPEKEIERLKHRIRGYKGELTKIKKQK